MKRYLSDQLFGRKPTVASPVPQLPFEIARSDVALWLGTAVGAPAAQRPLHLPKRSPIELRRNGPHRAARFGGRGPPLVIRQQHGTTGAWPDDLGTPSSAPRNREWEYAGRGFPRWCHAARVRPRVSGRAPCGFQRPWPAARRRLARDARRRNGFGRSGACARSGGMNSWASWITVLVSVHQEGRCRLE